MGNRTTRPYVGIASDLMDKIIRVVERFELANPAIETLHYNFNITKLDINKHYENNTTRRVHRSKQLYKSRAVTPIYGSKGKENERR